jgi:hypothetical protein
MQTKTVQLIGNPRDRALVDVTAYEIRGNKSIFVPYVPDDATYDDVAMAEYARYISPTDRGQLMLWVSPHMPMNALQGAVGSLLSGKRSSEGVWVLQGADAQGNLQMMPFGATQ